MSTSKKPLLRISMLEIYALNALMIFFLHVIAEGVASASKARPLSPNPDPILPIWMTFPVWLDFDHPRAFWLYAAIFSLIVSLIVSAFVVVIRRILPISWQERLPWTSLKTEPSRANLVAILCAIIAINVSVTLISAVVIAQEFKVARERAQFRVAIGQKLKKINGHLSCHRKYVTITLWKLNGEISDVIDILREMRACGYWKRINIFFKKLSDNELDALLELNGEIVLNHSSSSINPENRISISLDNRPPGEQQQCIYISWYPFGKGGDQQ